MIGDNIHRIMKEKGLTQAELAKLANISQASLSAIINNNSKPKAETIASLCAALCVPLALLEQQVAELSCCPRCRSRALTMWQSFANGACRFRCGFCDLDSGEQRSKEKAVAVLSSYAQKGTSQSDCTAVKVLSVAEVLSSDAYDANDVRPVWFENRGLFVVPALLLCGTAERSQNLVRVLWYGETGTRSFELDKYGSWWRIWSAKPSDGMIDSIPWDE